MKEQLVNKICDALNMVGKMIDNEEDIQLNDVWYCLDDLLEWVDSNVN